MFDSSLVVQSAVSSFNNAALFAPNFLWSAILALPIFAIFWIFAPQILARLMPNPRIRNHQISTLAIIIIAIFLLTHGSYAVVRDGVSGVGILVAVMLCACATFLSRRYYDAKTRLPQIINVNAKWKSRTDYAVPIVIAAIAGIAGGPGWGRFVLQFAVVAIGWCAGWLLYRKNARETDPKLIVGALIFLGAYGLVMQPEFFRFGQMGNLTVIHLLFLALTARILPAYFAFHFVRPNGWLAERTYRRLKLLYATGAVLLFALLLVTESALVFLAFAVGALVWSAITVRHATASTEVTNGVRHDLWFISLGLFGVLTAIPVLVCAAILLWRGREHSMAQLQKTLL